MNRTVTREQIERHLADQYAAWAKVIYPQRRPTSPSTLRFEYNDGASVYGLNSDQIIIHIPAHNERDFDNRVGTIVTKPNKRVLSRIELELLHEMMHELQFKERPEVTEIGLSLAARYKLPGAGHDAVFFTAIEISAVKLGVTPEELLLIIT